MFSFCLGNFFLSFFHIVSHALFKSLLFLTCGFIIIVGFSSQDMRYLGRKLIVRKSVFYLMFLSLIRLIGVFFLRGFFSKDLVVDAAFRFDLSVVYLLLFFFSCILSVFYRLKFLYEAFMGFQLGISQVVGSSLKLVSFILGLLFFWSIFFGKIFFTLIFDGELRSLVV